MVGVVSKSLSGMLSNSQASTFRAEHVYFTDDTCIRYGIKELRVFIQVRAVLMKSNRDAYMVQTCKGCKTRQYSCLLS